MDYSGKQINKRGQKGEMKRLAGVKPTVTPAFFLLNTTDKPRKNPNQGLHIIGWKNGEKHWYYGRKIRYTGFGEDSEMDCVIFDNGEFGLNYLELPKEARIINRNTIKEDYNLAYSRGMLAEEKTWSKNGYEPWLLTKTNKKSTKNSEVSAVSEGGNVPCLVKPKFDTFDDMGLKNYRKNSSSPLPYPIYTLTTLITLHQTTLKYPQTTLNFRDSSAPTKLKVEWISAKSLFDSMTKLQELYMDVFNPTIFKFTTAWAMATYCFELFPAFGYLFLNSDSETGKTKFAEIILNLSFNPHNMTSPSEAVLFRVIEQTKGTMLVDDYEKLPDDKRAVLDQILKVGYKRGGKAARAEKHGDGFIPVFFDVYSPKIITNTTTLENVLLSRCVPIHLMKTNSTKGKLHPDFSHPIWQFFRDACHNFVMDNWRTILKAYNEIDVDLNNRFLELVKPLLAIAKVVSEDYFVELRDFAMQAFQERSIIDVSQSWEFVLFSELYNYCDENEDWIPVKKIAGLVRDKFEEIQEDRKVPSSRWIGKKLSKIPIFKKRRRGAGVEYLLSKSLVARVMSSLGLPVIEAGLGGEEHEVKVRRDIVG